MLHGLEERIEVHWLGEYGGMDPRHVGGECWREGVGIGGEQNVTVPGAKLSVGADPGKQRRRQVVVREGVADDDDSARELVVEDLKCRILQVDLCQDLVTAVTQSLGEDVAECDIAFEDDNASFHAEFPSQHASTFPVATPSGSKRMRYMSAVYESTGVVICHAVYIARDFQGRLRALRKIFMGAYVIRIGQWGRDNGL